MNKPVVESAEERRKALKAAWDFGFDAAMDYRDRLYSWKVWHGAKPEPQLNPFKIEEPS